MNQNMMFFKKLNLYYKNKLKKILLLENILKQQEFLILKKIIKEF